MRLQNVSGMLIKQAMALPVFIIIPILFGFFANDYNSITQHMSEMTMDSRIANFIDKGSTVAAGVSVCLFGVGCLWWGGTLRWSFTMLVAVAGGMGMASNGVFEAGSPLHGLYGLPIFLVFVPAFFTTEFSVPTGKRWFRGLSLSISIVSLVYIWMLLVGLDPPEYRGLTQRIFSLLTFFWYSICVFVYKNRVQNESSAFGQFPSSG